MSDKNVKVFSTSTCPWCVRVKDYLDQKSVEYKDIDVSINMDEARKMIEKSGHQGVPQVWINDKVVVGFNQDKIDELLEE